MRPLLIVILSLCWIPVVWADWQAPPGAAIDLGALLSEIKAAGVSVEGASCRDEFGTVICHRDAGDFTDAEKASMDAALAVHDPDIRAKRTAKRTLDRASGESKLKALGLTQAELEAVRTR